MTSLRKFYIRLLHEFPAMLLGALIFTISPCFSGKSSAAEVGMIQPRDLVLPSCDGNPSDWCDYLVFFKYDSDPPRGDQAISVPPLRRALPLQIAHMPFDTKRLETLAECPLGELEYYADRLMSMSRDEFPGMPVIFDTPPSVDSCFQTTSTSFQNLSFIASGGQIIGFMFCEADYMGVDLCGIDFSRIQDGNEERISIASFRREEVMELFSAFPRIGSDTTDPAERGFVDAMTWLGGLFSQGVREVRIER